MSRDIEKLIEHLEYAYDGALAIGTPEDQVKIARAIAALKLDPYKEIFTKRAKVEALRLDTLIPNTPKKSESRKISSVTQYFHNGIAASYRWTIKYTDGSSAVFENKGLDVAPYYQQELPDDVQDFVNTSEMKHLGTLKTREEEINSYLYYIV